MSLYNKMRPSRLSEVRGQESVIRILKENLAPGGHLPNAMLFVGTRGTGKTTVAKIVAKQLNCESPLPDGSCCDQCATCRGIKNGTYLDVLELDAASNNGVDNIREIIEIVQFKPAGKMKVIILDEVHMLSKAAFNALLKIMEEPPANVLFILCTTELHEIPATILSRCRKFQFNTISAEVIVEKLREINRQYGITAENAALAIVARAANGSMRDAESIYESFLDAEGGIVTEKLVVETLGYTKEDTIFSVLEGIASGDPTISFAAVQQTVQSGGSLSKLLEETFRVIMDMITIHMGADISGFSANPEYLAKVSELAFAFNTERLFELADSFKSAFEKKGGNLELVFQSTIVGLVCRQSVISKLMERVEVLEKEVCILKQSHGVVSMSGDESEPVYEPGYGNYEDEEQRLDDSLSESISAPVQLNEEPDNVSVEVTADDEMESELAALGFTVVDDEYPFDEAEKPTSDEVEASINDSASSGKEKSVTEPSAGFANEDESDYFGEFARLFTGF